jgi:hypothetical protein
MISGQTPFVFPQPNFYSPYETPRFGSNKPIVKTLQEVFAFMHETPDVTFLRKISGKTAYGAKCCVYASM